METTFARVPAAIKPLPITKEFRSILSISSLAAEARTHRCVEHIIFYSCEVMQNISVKIWFLKKTTKNRIFGEYLLAATIFLYSTMLIWVSPPDPNQVVYYKKSWAFFRLLCDAPKMLCGWHFSSIYPSENIKNTVFMMFSEDAEREIKSE